MIRRPIVIDGILKEAGPGGFGGRTDGGDGQRIAILAGGEEERIAGGSLGKEKEKEKTPVRSGGAARGRCEAQASAPTLGGIRYRAPNLYRALPVQTACLRSVQLHICSWLIYLSKALRSSELHCRSELKGQRLAR
ncbi:hypothetical protein PGIGA_G00212530 [Pangasianodon gigas]|uniref:Uncharacterized protein n=1 Tax=Pangasianodon gigas TaxID=30993 RepID=A0ACC5WH09_PANGG|nr:hypothetical protein [Pangasianodon gigas]